MKGILWLIAWGTYFFFGQRAKKGSRGGLFFCCALDGGFLALLCFGLLPRALDTPFFYGAVALAAAGIALGLLLEKAGRGALLSLLLFPLLTLFFLWEKEEKSALFLLLLAFLGGMGLYSACCGLLPEETSPGEWLLPACFGGGGFLAGVLLFC